MVPHCRALRWWGAVKACLSCDTPHKMVASINLRDLMLTAAQENKMAATARKMAASARGGVAMTTNQSTNGSRPKTAATMDRDAITTESIYPRAILKG